MSAAPLGWLGIVRLGLVQTSIGAIVVLTTSTLNRVMVVELALPAVIPGFLVAIHYAVQALRPRWGYGSDVGGRLTQWIIGGMAMLAFGGILAAVATAWISTAMMAGLVLAFVAFLLIGIGVGACGTCLLVLLAKRVDPRRRVPAATIVWLMMIGGFAITATIAGHNLDPYTPLRLVIVTSVVSIAALLITIAAIWKVEGPAIAPAPSAQIADTKLAFRDALLQVWSEPQARRFTIFVFISMLAYSAQELILEPYAGLVFGLTPGQSTKLSGLQHGGVFVGMIVIALIGSFGGGFRSEASRRWAAGGCAASALALAFIATASVAGPAWPLREAVFALGVANGIFAAAAIGSMMAMASDGHSSREGVRMGLWGAAQGIAFGAGGLFGTIASDVARYTLGSPLAAYSTVFLCEAALFVVSAGLALTIGQREAARDSMNATSTNSAIARAPAG